MESNSSSQTSSAASTPTATNESPSIDAICGALKNVSARWKELGLKFNLHENDLHIIGLNNNTDQGNCLRDVIIKAKSLDDLSWESTVKALRSIREYRLANEIAASHGLPTVSPPTADRPNSLVLAENGEYIIVLVNLCTHTHTRMHGFIYVHACMNTHTDCMYLTGFVAVLIFKYYYNTM